VNEFAAAQANASVNAKDLAIGLSGMATSAFSLYMGYENVVKSQIMADRSNVMLERSTLAVQKAQEAYNNAVDKYGVNSQQAIDAADKLSIAQDALTVSQERAGQAQQNVNNALMYLGISILPTTITTIASFAKIMDALNITSAADLALKLAEVPAYIAATAASVAHSIADAVETAATWLLVTATATQIGLLTLGIGLAVTAASVVLFLATAHSQDAAATSKLNDVLSSTNDTLALVTDATNSLSDAQVYAAHAASTMDQQVRGATAELAAEAKENQTFSRSLVADWDQMQAKADTSLGAIQASFEKAFNAGNFDAATAIVRTFANKYYLSLSDAEKTIESFKAAQATIPQSIEQQLVGKAQADLKAFQDCASGKFAGLKDTSSASMKALVGDVNELLTRGLVGQAQDSIAAFQKCSTSKTADMVTSIKGSLADMVAAGINSAADMAKYATLTNWANAIELQTGLATAEATQVAQVTQLVTGGMTGGGGGGATRVVQMQTGGIVTRPTLAMIGESGPEAVVPLSRTSQSTAPITVNIHVDGHADMRTVEEIENRLKNVLIENSSANAFSTHKRIRFGNRVT
jgi:hypothetical protein